MIQKNLIALFAVAFLVTACSETSPESKEKIGAVAGAVIGSVGGSRIGASTGRDSGKILGASLGAIFGSVIGKEAARTFNEADLKRANETARKTMETAKTGQTVKWSNPDSGNSGTYKPTSGRRRSEDGGCRDFESTVVIDGAKKVAHGRACRQTDGSWKIVP